MRKIFVYIITIITIGLSSVAVSANSVSITYVQNLSNIPSVSGDLLAAKDRNKTGAVSFKERVSGHEVHVLHPNGTTYILATSGNNPMTIKLPGINDYANLLLDSGIFFKGDNGEKLIYYEFQNPASEIKSETSFFEASEDEIKTYGFRPYIIWDIETGKYDVVDKLTLYAVFHAGTDRRAFTDIVFPMDIDQLLMINLKWKYRYEFKVFGIGTWTDWRDDYTIRYEDEHVSATNFWHEYKKLLKLDYLFRPSSYNFERFNQQTIQDLGTVSDTYKYNYLNKVNKHLSSSNKDNVSVNDIFYGPKGYSVQRIYLNTYSDGLYTNYEVDDIVIVDLAYVYDGEYFHPQIHDIEWTSVGGKHNENEGIMPGIIDEFRSWLDDKFGWLKYPIIITIGIIALAFVVRIFGIVKKFIADK